MSIIKEEIKGNVIYNIIQSSNIVESVYDMESQIMTVKFKNGTEYQYKMFHIRCTLSLEWPNHKGNISPQK